MTKSRFLPGSFIVAAALLSGLTVATAQNANDTAPVAAQAAADAPDGKHDGHRGERGHRRGHGHHGEHGMMRQIMERVDANNDRAVTQEEVDTFRASVVTDADKSGEGNISLDEFETIYLDLTRERMVDAFQKLDADGDGAVTQAEMDKRFGDVVERMDRNGDGKLDREDHKRRGRKG
ncbi:EF-hand domain-containing protein [Roseovarius sp. ZX-A-9]|uniref:EF-hand domain-containing protein n=1 Tax=Roseovarius sp. ZX-A-9 TaxID=3014783 RepID=UPI00232CCF3C|nr:hypothetical protein [Roseovarius sp. ZX-A-9]